MSFDVNNLPKSFILAINTHPGKKLDAYKLIDIVYSKALCIVLNRTSSNLRSMLNKKGYDIDKLFFIDLVSNLINSELEIENAVYLKEKFTLDRLYAMMEKIIRSGSREKRMIVLDSLQDLLSYYSEDNLLRFLEHFIDRARMLNLNPVFIFDQGKVTSKIIRRLKVLCDDILYLK